MKTKLGAAAGIVCAWAWILAGAALAAGPVGNDNSGGNGHATSPAVRDTGPGAANQNATATPNRVDNRAENRADNRADSAKRDRMNVKGDDWRFVSQNGQWWYWMPDNRWVFWQGGRWVDYNPATYSQTGPMPYRAGYGGGDDWYYDDGNYYYYRRPHPRGNETFDRGNFNQQPNRFPPPGTRRADAHLDEQE